MGFVNYRVIFFAFVCGGAKTSVTKDSYKDKRNTISNDHNKGRGVDEGQECWRTDVSEILK